MRSLLKSLGLSALVALSACAVAETAPDPASVEASAREIHERVMTLDTHVDINPNNFRPDTTNYVSGLGTQVDLPKMEQGGLDAAFFSLYQGQPQGPHTPEGMQEAYATATAKIEAVRRLTSELAPDRIELARTAADARRIYAAGKKVAFMGMENGYAIGTDISRVKEFADAGTRYLSLAHNGHSQLSDSNTGDRDGQYMWNGLSPLGREVVTEANRWGIVLDVSHPSKQANLQTMELSRAPVMASHSAVRALGDHSRNMDDEQLRALQANGGVVQVVAFATYLKVNPPQPARDSAIAALRTEFQLPAGGGGRALTAAVDGLSPERRAEYQRRTAAIDEQHPVPARATVSDLVDHIDYVVRLIGVDHVGISSDFDGGGGVDGWDSATETFNVTHELVRRGYSEEDIAKIWSGNLLRVLEEAERVAAEMRRERP
jgi:membrane dipeptidase